MLSGKSTKSPSITKFPSVTLVITITTALLLAIFMVFVINIKFSYYWYFLHSDIVADLAFVREAASSFSLFPSGWAHLNEMRFIYITTPAILFYWITGNVHLAYALAVSSMVIINVALFYYMLNFKKRSLFVILTGAITFLMFFSRYDIFSVFSILFINGSLSVHLATLFLTVGVYLRIKYKAGKFRCEKILWVFTLLLAFAQGIQSSRMLGILYVPLLIVELLPVLRSVNNKHIKIVRAGMVYAFLAVFLNGLGMVVINLLVDNGAVVVESSGITARGTLAQVNIFVERFLDTVVSFFHSFGLVGGGYLVSIEGLIFAVRASFILAIIVIYKNIQKDEADKNLVSVFVATVISSIVAQTITHAGIGERFNFTATSLMAVLFTVSLSSLVENISITKKLESIRLDSSDNPTPQSAFANVLEYQNLQKYLAIIGVVVVLIGSHLSMSNIGTSRDYGLLEDRQRVIDFLMVEDLKVGYGAFWQGLVINGFTDWEIVVIPFRSNSGVTGRPLQQGVSYSDFHHDEERVFLVAATTHIEDAYNDTRMGSILEQGERTEFPGGWVVYVFETNHWAELK